MWAFSLFFRNFTSFFFFLFHFSEKPSSKHQFEEMVSLVSRTGRHLQRYDHEFRLVVGCIPYRWKKAKKPNSIKGTCIEDMEVLLISAQKGQLMLFPKGGWEKDETKKEAAARETLEEAGVIGNIESELGRWRYMGKRGGILHEVYMFPLLVRKQLDIWPEKDIRKRRWLTVSEAREVCQHDWMREALDELVRQHAQL